MDSMCHFAAKIPVSHDHSNMLRIHAGPQNPPVRQSLVIIFPVSATFDGPHPYSATSAAPDSILRQHLLQPCISAFVPLPASVPIGSNL